MANFRRIISATTLTLSLISLLSTINLSLAVPDDVFDLLPEFGLPKGLIPNAVKSFSITDDGEFEVELDRTCYVQFNELVYYDKKITGRLSYGAVSDVTGIQAKKFFVWVPVTGIKAKPNSDLIEFYVGILSEEFPAEQFQTIPVCKSKAYANPLETVLESYVSEV
ncbi:uncharacterized protein LOC122060999 [Macadamia integrifolia]|uniref:uncharacterized protein LOC122060999 n=1 Tax=Macadamia integrifolia TaxID=60698 RepID=UPI001C530BF2|nr:uncharacterized protein LOC122060999 [Macadamia integrifolia]